MNTNPDALQLAGEIRFLAMEFKDTYQRSKELRQKAIDMNWQSLFPNDAEVIGHEEGKEVTNADVRAFAQFLTQFMTFAEENSNQRINIVRKFLIRD